MPKKQPKEAKITEGQDDMIAYVEKAFTESRESKSREAQEWKVDYQMFKGLQDIRYSPTLQQLFVLAPFIQKPVDAVANRIFGYVLKNASNLATDQPFLGVMPATAEEEDIQHAKMLRKVFESLWHQHGLKKKVGELATLASIYGTGFMKVRWDGKKGRGGYDQELDKEVREGDFAFDVLSVWDVFPDPRATEVEECRFIIHAKPVHIQDIQDRYGVDVTADGAVSATMEDEMLMLQEHDVTMADDVVEVKNSRKDAVKKKTSKTGYILLKECWTKEYVTTVAGGHLLKRVKNETGMYPFVPFYDYKEPRRFWGMGEPRPVRDLQRRFNQLLTQILKNVKLANTKVLKRKSADLFGSISTEVGQQIEWEGEPPQFQPGTPVTSDLFVSLDRIARLMDEVSNQTVIDPVSLTKSNISGRFVEAYQNVSNIPLRYKKMIFEDSLVQMGRYLLKLMQLNFDTPRLFRILGANHEPDFVEISKDQIKAGVDVYFSVQNMLPDTKVGKQDFILQLVGAKIVTPDQAKKMMGLEGILSDIEESVLQTQRDPEKVIREAEYENELIAKNQMPVVRPKRLEDAEAHIKLHYQFMQNYLKPGSREEQKMHLLISREEQIVGNVQPFQPEQPENAAPNPLGFGGPVPGQQPLPDPGGVGLPPQGLPGIPEGVPNFEIPQEA
jgi:hypothetical protein